MPDVVQIIVTPGSGDGRARATARRLQKALVRRGYAARIQTFADLERLLEWSATCEPDYSHLVAVGGDATLSAAAAAAVRLSIPFLPVPTGFGNMFARAFGFGDQTHRVIEHFERGQVRRVDVGVYPGERIFLSHRSYGLLEEIQRAVERGRAQPRPSRLLPHGRALHPHRSASLHPGGGGPSSGCRGSGPRHRRERGDVPRFSQPDADRLAHRWALRRVRDSTHDKDRRMDAHLPDLARTPGTVGTCRAVSRSERARHREWPGVRGSRGPAARLAAPGAAGEPRDPEGPSGRGRSCLCARWRRAGRASPGH